MFPRVINQVKGVAILLVVLGHIKSPSSDLIYSFHMPLFFFIGGIFINKAEETLKFFKKNFYRLIIPYLIFNAVGITINCLKNITLHRPQDSFSSILEGVFLWADPAHMHHYGFVLWFLPALFWGRMIFYILEKISPFPSVVNFIITLGISWLGGTLYLVPLGIDKGMLVAPWIALGYFYHQFTEGKFFKPNITTLFLLIILSLFICLWGVPSVDLGVKQIDDLFKLIPYTLLTIILIIYFIYIININKILLIPIFFEYVGSFTLFIMVIHVYTNNITGFLISNILRIESWSLIFISSLALIFFSIRLKKLVMYNFLLR
jgi:fucose 4-O-acetylase-like acetyltransferase